MADRVALIPGGEVISMEDAMMKLEELREFVVTAGASRRRHRPGGGLGRSHERLGEVLYPRLQVLWDEHYVSSP